MIDKKPFMVTNETVKNWAKTTYEVSEDVSIQDICFSAAFIAAHEMACDLLDARELIDKQEAIIKEMRRFIARIGIYQLDDIDVEDRTSCLEKTKDYA